MKSILFFAHPDHRTWISSDYWACGGAFAAFAGVMLVALISNGMGKYKSRYDANDEEPSDTPRIIVLAIGWPLIVFGIISFLVGLYMGWGVKWDN